MPKEKYDWQINKINDHTIPKRKIRIVKLNKKEQVNVKQQKKLNWGFETKMPKIWDEFNVNEKLLASYCLIIK